MLVCSNENLVGSGIFAKFLVVAKYVIVLKSGEIAFITGDKDEDEAKKRIEEVYGIDAFEKFYKLQEIP